MNYPINPSANMFYHHSHLAHSHHSYYQPAPVVVAVPVAVPVPYDPCCRPCCRPRRRCCW